MRRGNVGRGDSASPLAGKAFLACHVVHGHSSGLRHDVVRIVHVWWLVAVRRAVDAIRAHEVAVARNRVWSDRP